MQRPVPIASRLSLAAALLLLAPATPPAWAIVVHHPEESKLEEKDLEEAAHEAGKPYRFVVAINSTGHGPDARGDGSGSYLGPGADERYGWVLTAGHLLVQGASFPAPTALKEIQVFFGSTLWDPDAPGFDQVEVKADRAYLHPRFRLETSADGSESLINDVALLRFPLEPAAEGLKRMGITPARLHGGPWPQKILQEAVVAGFGSFATSRSGAFSEGRIRIHAGKALVSLRGDAERFQHWAQLSADMEEEAAADPDTLPRFILEPQLASFFEDSGEEPWPLVPVRSHPEQVLTASGDSGSPLIVETKHGLGVAGIHTCSFRSWLEDAEGDPVPFHTDVWEPVRPHLAMIRAVMAGEACEATVIVPGPAVAEEETKAPAPRPGKRKQPEPGCPPPQAPEKKQAGSMCGSRTDGG